MIGSACLFLSKQCCLEGTGRQRYCTAWQTFIHVFADGFKSSIKCLHLYFVPIVMIMTVVWLWSPIQKKDASTTPPTEQCPICFEPHLVDVFFLTNIAQQFWPCHCVWATSDIVRCESVAIPWRCPRIAGVAGQNCGEGRGWPFTT